MEYYALIKPRHFSTDVFFFSNLTTASSGRNTISNRLQLSSSSKQQQLQRLLNTRTTTRIRTPTPMLTRRLEKRTNEASGPTSNCFESLPFSKNSVEALAKLDSKKKVKSRCLCRRCNVLVCVVYFVSFVAFDSLLISLQLACRFEARLVAASFYTVV